MTHHIEMHGAGVRKDLAAALMGSANGRAKLADPEFREGLAESKEGRAALAKIDKAKRSSNKKSTPAAAPGGLTGTMTARSAYGPDSRWSFFRDLARVAHHDQRWSNLITAAGD